MTVSHDIPVANIKPNQFKLFGQTTTRLDIFLLALILAALGLQLHLQFIQKINWDEFFYLSHIYSEQRGTLDKVLQKAHVHLLGWITAVPGGEINQIIIGRIVMWCVQLGTLVLVVKTVLRFLPLSSALFSTLAFLSIGFIFIHGTSFRADPFAAFLAMYCTYVLAATELRKPSLAGLAAALALAGLVTIKIILFAPLFAFLALWRLRISKNPKSLFIRFTATFALAVLLFVIGYALQKLVLPASAGSEETQMLGSTFDTVFLSSGLFPRSDYMLAGFVTGLISILMIAFGLILATLDGWKQSAKSTHPWVLFGFGLPLLTFIFYRNAYPYFYAFIFPPAVLLAGYAFHRLKPLKILTIALPIMMVFNIGSIYFKRLSHTQGVQAQTLNVVHSLFPEPVNYFDRNGMVASFPKAGFFMSTWGLRNYHLKSEPQFLTAMTQKTIPLLIDNSPALSSALHGEASVLLEQDITALTENYIQHWGPIWVAGKDLNVTDKIQEFEILVPGIYTLESDAPILIDGKEYFSGATIQLDRGQHSVASKMPHMARLRWGDHLHRPDMTPPSDPIFEQF